MWQEYINATCLNDVTRALKNYGERARVVAGATDLILELENGKRENIHLLIDVSRVSELSKISLDESGLIHIGAAVTHNQCVESLLLRDYAFPLARAAWAIGSPQIRNRGTVGGNLITASPANDTISPLMALGAEVVLRNQNSVRRVPLDAFYTGVRKTVLEPDEVLEEITFPAMKRGQRGTFIKHALRQAQAISLVNVALVITFDTDKKISAASITLGAVAPTIIHALQAEKFLLGKKLNDKTILKAAELCMNAGRPINDVRSSAAYRSAMVKVITQRGLTSLGSGTEREGYPEKPVLLAGLSKKLSRLQNKEIRSGKEPIETVINGKTVSFEHGQNKTLLRLLREDGHLIGTKEGCAEGECGACTVYLDGMAVMSCMVPAPRAHGAEIITIEGLAEGDLLHPVQEGFIEEGAVQCGYCTPGFIMSGAKLLEEKANPSKDDIMQAFTGNLCRCTGYYKIIKAMERASILANNE
jgi:xanthine dehydrogenase iron-sulfur cluster and FAD-binding subunit A